MTNKNHFIFSEKNYVCCKLLIVLILSAALISACNQTEDQISDSLGIDPNAKDSSASTWIEYPLEEWVIPNQPVVFVVYAGGTEGVLGIKLTLNGQPLPSLGVQDLSTDGSERQVRMEYPWQPPAEGSYILAASAISKGGGASPGAQVNFCVVSCEPQETEETATPTDTPTPTPTPEPGVTPSVTPKRQITVAPKPTDTSAPPPPPPADTSGPSIASGGLIFESCRAFGQAAISDPSGVAWAKFGYNLNGEGWRWVWMQNLGGMWKSEAGAPLDAGIGTPIGDIQYQFQAADSLGNESLSGVFSYSYTSCGG